MAGGPERIKDGDVKLNACFLLVVSILDLSYLTEIIANLGDSERRKTELRGIGGQRTG